MADFLGLHFDQPVARCFQAVAQQEFHSVPLLQAVADFLGFQPVPQQEVHYMSLL